MPLTCAQKDQALTHVLTNVFPNPDVHADIQAALHKTGEYSPEDVVSMSNNNIDSLTYDEQQGNNTHIKQLQSSSYRNLKLFKWFICYEKITNNREFTTLEHWLAITRDEYDNYRAFIYEETDPTTWG